MTRAAVRTREQAVAVGTLWAGVERRRLPAQVATGLQHDCHVQALVLHRQVERRSWQSKAAR
jgi:hypothetical protein